MFRKCMEFDDFVSPPRWQILDIIAREPTSPVNISEKIKTSVAYVSQQLKILEAANLVKKKKTGAVEKGKPRSLYSIVKNTLYLTALMNNSPAKKQINPNPHQEVILKIWLTEDPKLHYFLEKLYWKLEPFLDLIKGIILEQSLRGSKLFIISNEKDVKSEVASFLKGIKNGLDCQVIRDFDLGEFDIEDLVFLYDPQKIFGFGGHVNGGT